MNKVYFVLGGYYGCNYVRALLPMWENGWNGNKTTITQENKPVDVVRNEIMDSDIIVFHRPEIIEYHKLAHLLKSMGKKIVFDNDDTYNLEKDNPFYAFDAYGDKDNTKMRGDIIHNFITNSDLVTTTTKYLAKEYGKFNKNVVILPNCINEDDWDEPLRNTGSKIRIGIVGSTVYTTDVMEIEDEIRELSDRDDVELVIFGLQSKKHRKENEIVRKVYRREYKFWDTLNIEHVPFVKIKDYPDLLNELRLDIMLIPRKDCYFNKCKSNVKFLEAAMCEIPVIATSFKDGPYEDIDYDAIIRIPVGRPWFDSINMLIDNMIVRREMGKKAKQYALDNFNIKDNAHLWDDAYNKLK